MKKYNSATVKLTLCVGCNAITSPETFAGARSLRTIDRAHDAHMPVKEPETHIVLAISLLESEVMASNKWTHLLVERKEEVIKHANDTEMSVRVFAENFGIGKTQVAEDGFSN